MGRVEPKADTKSHLVSEICSISSTPVACVHRHGSHLANSHFIDWYRILGVEEDAGVDVIRKQYHKLALQLHPDKNKHPKAEIAFKLVSEGYTRLSDDVRRRAFNLERWKNFCIKCNRIPYAEKPKSSNLTNWSRTCRILQGLKDVRNRFKEEARVIDTCLKTNNLFRRECPPFNPAENLLKSNSQCKSKTESPIFDPSDYIFQGYPHIRSQIYKKPENFWYLQRGNVLNHGPGRNMHDFPVFENRPEWRMFKSKSTCVRS